MVSSKAARAVVEAYVLPEKQGQIFSCEYSTQKGHDRSPWPFQTHSMLATLPATQIVMQIVVLAYYKDQEELLQYPGSDCPHLAFKPPQIFATTVQFHNTDLKSDKVLGLDLTCCRGSQGLDLGDPTPIARPLPN